MNNVRCVFVRFEVGSREGISQPSETLGEIAQMCWDWASTITKGSIDPFPRDWKTGTFSSISTKKQRNFTADVSDINLEYGRLWELAFANIDLKTKTTWKNTIHLLISNQKLEFSLLQEVRFENPHISTFKEKISPPKLIRKIMDDSRYVCTNGDFNLLSFNPKHTMNGEEIFEQIVEKDRKIPLILMSKTFDNKKCLINPTKLANRLSGLANVFVVRNLYTKKFNEPLGKQWVTNGSLRIYWPGCNSDDLLSNEDYDNLYTKSRFNLLFDKNENDFCDHIVDTISRSSGMSFVPNQIASDIRRDYLDQEAEREADLLAIELKNSFSLESENLTVKLTSLTEKYSTQSKELKRVRREKTDADNRAIDLENRGLTLQSKITGLEENVAKYKPLEYLMNEVRGKNPALEESDFVDAWKNLAEDEEEIEPEPEEEIFDTISDAVAKAREDFGRYILILDDAFNSANKTNSDAKPNDVYEFFKWLYECVKSKTKLTHKSFNEEYVGKYAEMESSETLSRYKKEHNSKGRKFKLSINGMLKHRNHALIQLAPHMKFGSKSNPLRIHFRVFHNIGEIPKIWVKKGPNWMEESKKDSRKNFTQDPPFAIIGWIGDHLPM